MKSARLPLQHFAFIGVFGFLAFLLVSFPMDTFADCHGPGPENCLHRDHYVSGEGMFGSPLVQEAVGRATPNRHQVRVTFDVDPTQGNLLVGVLSSREAGSGSWPAGWIVEYSAFVNGQRAEWAYKMAGAGEPSTVRVNLSGDRGSSLVVAEFVDVVATTPKDVSVSNNSGTNAVNSINTGTTPLTSQANTLLVGLVAGNSSDMKDLSWSNENLGRTRGFQRYTNSAAGMGVLAVNAQGSYSATAVWDNNVSAQAGIIAFRMTAAYKDSFVLPWAAATIGDAGPPGPDDGSFDHIIIEDLDPGRYRVKTTARYAGTLDEHMVVESSTGDIEPIWDQNPYGCEEGGWCEAEIENIEICGGGGLPSTGSLEIRSYSPTAPASLDVFRVKVERVGETIECVNPPPSATNLQITELDYCFAFSPPIRLEWDFTDPGDTQSAYRVQFDTNSDFSGVPDTCPTPNSQDTCKVSNDSDEYPPPGLAYGTQYFWRVNVWDSAGGESGWVVYNDPSDADGDGTTQSFTTDAHVWPDPRNLEVVPPNPAVGQNAQFFDDDEGPGGNSLDGDPFDPAATPTNGPCGSPWCWDFEDDGTFDSTLEDPTHTYPSVGSNDVTLIVTDELGSCSHTKQDLNTTPPFPGWKEISPF